MGCQMKSKRPRGWLPTNNMTRMDAKDTRTARTARIHSQSRR